MPLVEFPLDNETVIVVEIPEPRTGVARAGLGDAVARAKRSLGQALAIIRPVAQGVLDKIRSLPDPPDEVQVEFGLKLHAEVGAVLAASATEAHYRVTLTWRKEKPRQA